MRVQSFPNLLTQGVRLVACSSTSTSKFVFWSGRPITPHNQFAFSQAHRACDQPLHNLQRIHFHVSGCSTSRDHVPILYDILYWGWRWVGGGGLGCCAEFHGSRSERTDGQLIEVRIPPPGSRTRFPVPRCSMPGLKERRGARAF